MHSKTVIAYNLRRLRVHYNVTQREFSKAVFNLPQTRLSQYERGTRMPNLQKLEIIFQLFHLSGLEWITNIPSLDDLALEDPE